MILTLVLLVLRAVRELVLFWWVCVVTVGWRGCVRPVAWNVFFPRLFGRWRGAVGGAIVVSEAEPNLLPGWWWGACANDFTRLNWSCVVFSCRKRSLTSLLRDPGMYLSA